MKTIVFLNTQKSGSSREAIKAAEELGYYTVLFTDKPNMLKKRTEFPDVHLMRLLDLNNLEEIRMAIKALILRALDICAIVSFTDPYCHTACVLAEEFGVNKFSTESIKIMEDKILSREVISNLPYVPRFLSLDENTAISNKEIKSYMPAIIKSPNSTGSKDVFKVSTIKEFKAYRANLYKKYPRVPVLVEEFLDGPQYLVECIVIEKKVQIVAIIQQEITYCQRFIITGYNLMIDPPTDFYEKLKNAVESIVQSHGMQCGSCHLEMRYANSQWKLIEINPRISGAGMNKFIEIGLGINLVKETLKLSLGQEINLECKYKNHTFSQYVIISETGILVKVTGRNKASKCPGVKFVYVKPRKGALLTPPTSMGNRYAYVIATGENEEQARENGKFAASQIEFSLLPPPEEVEKVVPIEYKDTDVLMKGLEQNKNPLIKDGKSKNKAKQAEMDGYKINMINISTEDKSNNEDNNKDSK
jgi:biotin carboxylase